MLLIVIIVSYCNVKIYKKFEYNFSDNPWINAFKDRVFISSLKEAYKTDTIIFNHIEQKDALNPFDGLTLLEMRKADQIGLVLIHNMPPPAMCEGCKSGMNYFMATLLHYYNSRELDKLTRRLYKEHKK